MKAFKFFIYVAFVGLTVATITGCGGGGGGGTTPPPATGLTPEKANAQLASVASVIGCSYTPTVVAKETESGIALALRTANIFKNASVNTGIAIDFSVPLVATSEIAIDGGLPAVAAMVPGTCGGSLTMPDLYIGTYQFDNFCYSDPDSGAAATINGSLNVQYDGSAVGFNTITPLSIVSTNPTLNVTIDLQGGSLGMSGLDLNSINSVSIASIVLTNNTAGTSYTIANLNAYLNGNNIAIGAAVYDPAIGDLVVDGTINSDNGSANINIADQHANTVVVSGSNAVYSATHNGSPLGTMDCSMAGI